MICHVKLFARARDLAGASEVSVTLSDAATVKDLRAALARDYPALAGLLERSALAVLDEFAGDDLVVPPGAEVALLPPVSGG
jgi:molybdopterin converting factor subunit 1